MSVSGRSRSAKKRNHESSQLLPPASKEGKVPLEMLVERCQPLLLRIARCQLDRKISRRCDEEDLLQDVWLKLLEKPPSAEVFESIERANAYIGSMVCNSAWKSNRQHRDCQCRSIHRDVPLDAALLPETEPESREPDAFDVLREIEFLESLMGLQLSLSDRLLLFWAYLGYTCHEIAPHYGTEAKRIRSYLLTVFRTLPDAEEFLVSRTSRVSAPRYTQCAC